MGLVTVSATTVDFSGMSIKVDTEEEAEIIVKALNNSPGVSVFCLSGNTLGVDGAKSLGSALSNKRDLTRCLFSDIFTGRMVDEIAPALRHLSHGIMTSGARLTELDLSDNAFGPRGVVGVTDLLSSPTCFTLKILKMDNQGLGHQGAKHLADALTKGIKESKGEGLKLVHFSAGRNRLENVGIGYLSDVFVNMHSLEELYLYQNGIGIHGSDGIKALTFAISKNPNMRILNLSDNSLKEEGGVEISKVLRSIPRLEELILDDCLIRSRGCTALANSLDREDVVPALKRLSLYGNEIKRNAGISLAFSLGSKSRLSLLCLNGNEFGQEGIENILEALSSVNLLPAVEEAGRLAKEENEADDGTDDVDLSRFAFNEDMGSCGEEDDEADQLDTGGETDYYDDDDEEVSKEYGDDDEEFDEQENSFNTVNKNPKPVAFSFKPLAGDSSSSGGFSFRSCLSNLQKETPSGKSLFVGINPASAASPGCLFGTEPTATVSSGLFAPPKLGISPTASTSSSLFCNSLFANSQSFNENALLELVKSAVKDTETEATLESLIDSLSTIPPPTTWQLSPSKLPCVLPESVVRLAFRMSQRSSTQECRNLARDLLFSALAHKIDDFGVVSQSARAVNRVLLHLGLIKPDRTDSVERKVEKEVTESQTLNSSLELVSALIDRYGDQLGDEVRKPLALFISQHRGKNSSLEALLGVLEGQISKLSLSS